ncbi:alpha/beta hydrolase [Bacillus sp. Marseille-P3661]|uniref:alpha/beta hydrolase n=1 Tax=Bacillus sp. Marseille-P3661 TaxID=1936234 RepID=UPI000C860B28|nr:alpha/beta hydrolase [Bacillus sp. Marseille-P3661]
MKIDRRFLKIDSEWNVVHLPEQPNGFAILIIGDRNHYVDESTSLWIQNPDRLQMLEMLRKKGYTIFYSNLYGRHWGSPKAVDLLIRFYQMLMRNEILNNKIHIIAEGMGALAALKFVKKMDSSVRSIVMMSPCIDLKKYMEHEKVNKLFYKHLLKELSFAYDIEERFVEQKVIKPFDVKYFTACQIPVKICQSTNRISYNINDHGRMYERSCGQQSPISLTLHLFEKRFNITQNIIKFLTQYEKVL